jgi:hypothetical protein
MRRIFSWSLSRSDDRRLRPTERSTPPRRLGPISDRCNRSESTSAQVPGLCGPRQCWKTPARLRRIWKSPQGHGTTNTNLRAYMALALFLPYPFPKSGSDSSQSCGTVERMNPISRHTRSEGAAPPLS